MAVQESWHGSTRSGILEDCPDAHLYMCSGIVVDALQMIRYPAQDGTTARTATSLVLIVKMRADMTSLSSLTERLPQSETLSAARQKGVYNRR